MLGKVHHIYLIIQEDGFILRIQLCFGSGTQVTLNFRDQELRREGER